MASEMWYFPLLKPYEDHIPVKADMSDLQQQIEWCRENDAKCQEIAARAKDLYQRYVSRDGILDYMQAIFHEIAVRTHRPPEWAQGAPPRQPVPYCEEAVGHSCERVSQLCALYTYWYMYIMYCMCVKVKVLYADV